jgi:hypothetical protein
MRGIGRNPAMRGLAIPSQTGWNADGACAKLNHRSFGDFAARLPFGRRKEAAMDRAKTRCVLPERQLDRTDGGIASRRKSNSSLLSLQLTCPS